MSADCNSSISGVFAMLFPITVQVVNTP